MILVASVGLGFVNEYRAERAAEALHTQIRHTSRVVRDGRPSAVDVTRSRARRRRALGVGDVVPADVRLIERDGLECDESVLTGESLPADEVARGRSRPAPRSPICRRARSWARSCTTAPATASWSRTGGGDRVRPDRRSGSANASRRPSSRRAAPLLGAARRGRRRADASIFVINVLLRPAAARRVLFSLAIAVGITPQLLPAVVTTSLATGSRRLAAQEGARQAARVHRGPRRHRGAVHRQDRHPHRGPRSAFERRSTRRATTADDVVRARACSATRRRSTDGSASAATRSTSRSGRRRTRRPMPAAADRPSAIAAVRPRPPNARRCSSTTRRAAPARDQGRPGVGPRALRRRHRRGPRERSTPSSPPAAGSSPSPPAPAPELDDDHRRRRARPRPRRLPRLPRPAEGVGGRVPRPARPSSASPSRSSPATTRSSPRRSVATSASTSAGTLTGADIDALDDDALARRRRPHATIFARVSPEQKARLIRAQRAAGRDVAFLGDGVNDALALHAADVGISVDSATDVAKDAADIVLLEKDLDVLADGVAEGRRIFANTIKYVLMGTSSNFGNMFSAAVRRRVPVVPADAARRRSCSTTCSTTPAR